MEGKILRAKLKDFEISGWIIYMNTKIVQDNSDAWVKEENSESDQSFIDKRKQVNIYNPVLSEVEGLDSLIWGGGTIIFLEERRMSYS